MKKYFIILAILFSISFSRAYSQEMFFDVSMGYSMIRDGGNLNSALGCDLALGGVYFDYSQSFRNYSGTTRVGVWEDSYGISWHVGYLIPIKNTCLKIAPLLGYSFMSYGITDGYDWSVSESGINNEYHESYRRGGFDPGVAIKFHIPMVFNGYRFSSYYTVTTRMTRYSFGILGGVSINL